MVDVRDISAGNFQGNIVLVYEDKPTNNKIDVYKRQTDIDQEAPNSISGE